MAQKVEHPSIEDRKARGLAARDKSITAFAERYADQNDRDYKEFVNAIHSWRLEAVEGV